MSYSINTTLLTSSDPSISLGEPKPPWDNKYGEKENAWTNALEFAIVKAGAQGKSTDKDALAAITKYLHSGHGLVYDTVKGAPRY